MGESVLASSGIRTCSSPIPTLQSARTACMRPTTRSSIHLIGSVVGTSQQAKCARESHTTVAAPLILRSHLPEFVEGRLVRFCALDTNAHPEKLVARLVQREASALGMCAPGRLIRTTRSVRDPCLE